ncbi:MAG: energy-coupling factor ABC transporter permease [Parcubacteria group bacterium]
MHIPDGFLSPGTSVVLLGVAAGFLVHSLAKVRQKFLVREKSAVLATPDGLEMGGRIKQRLTRYGRAKIWRMASVAAFIFAAQMINFPVAQGTSGHLLGGVLAAILLGPLEGFLVIAAVLIVQSLVFADGGLLALGANIVNMGLIGSMGGYYLYVLLKKRSGNKWLAVGLAAWLSVVVASAFCSLELAISGTSTLILTLAAMVKVHMLIGVGEAIVTIAMIKILKDAKSKS